MNTHNLSSSHLQAQNILGSQDALIGQLRQEAMEMRKREREYKML